MILSKRLFFYSMLLISSAFLHRSIFAQAEKSKKDPEEKIEQVKVGNFALKPSQQAGPLISFGQNMVEKRDLQFFSFIDDFVGNNKKQVTIIPTILYGFQDNFSLYAQIPVIAKYREDSITFHGLQDILIQLEYAFYDHVSEETTSQMSIVVNTTLPTGDASFQSTHPRFYGNYGSPTFFIGFTADHFTTRWYPFVSFGAKIATKNESITSGDQFLYQWGLSRNIAAQADAYIFNVMVEFDGTYRKKDKINGMLDPNSGGNQILFGPSLWLSTPHFSFQIGLSGVIYQHLYGEQNKDTYFLSVNVGYKF